MVEDIGKYLYNKQKEDKLKKKTQKQTSKWFKEIKLSYGIGENDLQLKIKKTEELLEEWYSVKCVVRLKGRERGFAQKVIDQLTIMQQTLSHVWRSQYPQPKVENNGISIILLPKK
jgi:translation initiation factor IF-3